jgi:hypothetical protein
VDRFGNPFQVVFAVEASIQIVLLRQVKFLAQQIAHRTSFKPLPMQSPFAARIDNR